MTNAHPHWGVFFMALAVCYGIWELFSSPAIKAKLDLKMRLIAATLLCVAFVWVSWPELKVLLLPDSSISMKAFVTPTYPKNYVVGTLKWPDDNIQAITLSINSLSEYPIRDIDLTIQVLDKSDDLLLGMSQLGDVAGVTFSPPQFPDLMLRLRGTDGKDYDLSSRDMLAVSGGAPAFGDYWKAFCPTLPTGVDLRLVLAAVNTKDRSAPKKLRILGSYEETSNDNNKVIKFDKTLNVTR